MENKIKVLEEKLEKLDTYTKNTVGYLEGKVKESESTNSKIIDALYQEIMAMGNFVNNMFIQVEGLCDLLIEGSTITKEELLASFNKKQEAVQAELQKKAQAEQSGLVDVNGKPVKSVVDDTKAVPEVDLDIKPKEVVELDIKPAVIEDTPGE